MSDNDQLYTVAEAAAILGISNRWIQKQAQKQKIPGAHMSANRAGKQYYLIPKSWVQSELKKTK